MRETRADFKVTLILTIYLVLRWKLLSGLSSFMESATLLV